MARNSKKARAGDSFIEVIDLVGELWVVFPGFIHSFLAFVHPYSVRGMS
jgi:hypothetical protein